MALEDLTGTGKYINALNNANPASSDFKSEGDDHIRGVKNVLLNTFPNITGSITPTQTELNYVDGVTSAIQTQLDAKASLANVQTLSDLFIGMVAAFPVSTPPTGWLECDGSAISAGYTKLIALVGANTPDLRGEFIRGWDNGRGIDSGRAIKSSQLDAFKLHSHSIETKNNAASGSGTSHASTAGTPTSGIIGSTGASETRPRNIALMYCIKHD